MELNSVYTLANVINESIMKNVLDKSILNDMVLTIKVAPNILYGIDKEFYRMSHDDNIEGFIHKDKVLAKINAINFVFESNNIEEKSTN